MDPRIMGRKDFYQKEREAAEKSKSITKRSLYLLRPLRNDPLGVAENRIIVLLWRPGVVCPEIFSQFYSSNDWDYKAGVCLHYISNEDLTKAVVCFKNTTIYYNRWCLNKHPVPECSFCNNGLKSTMRYIFQVFDYQKLIGERLLDEGEERPSVQVLIAPERIFFGLDDNFRVGNEFWDRKVVRIKKDTRNGYNFSDYSVIIEETPPPELSNESLRKYLMDESNHINPVKEDLIRLSLDDNYEFGAEDQNNYTSIPVSSPVSSPASSSVSSPSSIPTSDLVTSPGVSGRKINW